MQGPLSGGGAGSAGTPGPQAPIGTGAIDVALLLPMTAGGEAGGAARAVRNAAELAMSEVQEPSIRVLPVDTGGTPDGARAAAERAIEAGAKLILGPVAAASVQAAGAAGRSAGVPVIAFTDDASAAGPGVYIMGFSPEDGIDRVVGFAAKSGKRSFAALLPEGGYGTIVEAALQEAAPRHGGRVVSIARYADANSAAAAIAATAAVAVGASPQADVVLVPDGPEALRRLLPALARAGVTTGRVQVLGSARWNDAATWQISEAQGGWYAGPDPQRFSAFAQKYKARYGDAPPTVASLGYDAVSLAAALARIGGPDGFSPQVLTNSDGFAGVDGLFRFRRNGQNDRGLAIIQVMDGTAGVLDPAPAAF